MCRWAAWVGKPIFLEELICRPDHSLIQQSRNAVESKATINADGFGVAWYGDRREPGLYKDIGPAWSDPNLNNLAHQVRAPLFLAHVRASTGTATSYNNCHPFTHGRWSFMHNGMAGGFDALRKRADMAIPDALYGDRKGATDSEALFLIALGFGLDRDPLDAMCRSVQWLEAAAREQGKRPHMRFTGCWSDGERLFAGRYASDAFAPSLYVQSTDEGTMVVSEPLDDGLAGWQEVPAGQCLTIENGRVSFSSFCTLEAA